MLLTIKYFGMLAEVTKCSEERIEIAGFKVKELTEKLLAQYPDLKNKNFKVAINQVLADDTVVIEEHSEIALLPPFAGG